METERLLNQIWLRRGRVQPIECEELSSPRSERSSWGGVVDEIGDYT